MGTLNERTSLQGEKKEKKRELLLGPPPSHRTSEKEEPLFYAPCSAIERERERERECYPVSYTHLTLPTNREV